MRCLAALEFSKDMRTKIHAVAAGKLAGDQVKHEDIFLGLRKVCAQCKKLQPDDAWSILHMLISKHCHESS